MAETSEGRIRTEIEAHYREAVADHISEGIADSRARRLAVAELGDSLLAWRRFRRQHLTNDETRGLKRAGSVWMLMVCYSVLCFLWYSDDFPRPFAAALWAVAVFEFAVLPTALFVMLRRKCRTRNGFLIILLQHCIAYVFVPCLFLADGSSGRAIWILLIVWAWPFIIRPIRIWSKLRKSGDEWQGMPPPSTASS